MPLTIDDGSIHEVFNPPRVLLGDGSVEQVGTVLARYAEAGRVLIVADKAMLSLGVEAKIAAFLSDAGFTSDSYAEIEAEPELASLEALATVARAKPYCAVVGIGGGSALDPAKLAAVFIRSADSAASYLAASPITSRQVPLLLVPTTAGTGAEASRNSIVTHEGRKVVISGPALVADAVILDATLGCTAPAGVTASSGLDALAHAIETYLSSAASSLTAANSLAAAQLVARWLPVAYAQPANVQARRSLLYAAHLAGLAINAVVVLGHSMAYTIAVRTHLPHGVTTGMSLPYCLAYNSAEAGERIQALGAAVGASTSLPVWVRDLASSLAVPTSLEAVGVTESDIPSMVQECLNIYPRPNNPVPLDEERLAALYRKFLVGDLDAACG